MHIRFNNFKKMNFNLNLEELLSSYQSKIGLYDKQSWEATVEQRILRGLSYSPRKTAKLKTNFIDVDLIRGKEKFCSLKL